MRQLPISMEYVGKLKILQNMRDTNMAYELPQVVIIVHHYWDILYLASLSHPTSQHKYSPTISVVIYYNS